MNRRRYLRTVGAASVGSLAGCPALSQGPDHLRWSVETSRPVTGLAAGSEAVYAVTVPDDSVVSMMELGLAEGDTRWSRDIGVSGAQLSVRYREGYLVFRNGRTLIVTPSSFTRTSWRRQGATPPVFHDGVAYLRTVEGGVTWIEAVSIETGATTWRVNISDRNQIPETQYPIAYADQTIGVTDRRFPLTARSITDGSVRWRSDTTTGSLGTATADTFYIGMEAQRNATVTAFDARTGDRTQLMETAATTTVPQVIGDLLRVRVTGEPTDAIAVYDTATNDERWRKTGFRGRTTWSTPDTFYAIDTNDRFCALDSQTGTVAWRQSIPVGTTLPRVGITDQSVIVHAGSDLLALARTDGAIRWRIELTATDAQAPTPITTTATTVLAADDVTVSAYDA